MIWWIIVAAYVASVVLAIVAVRVDCDMTRNYKIGWEEVIVSLIPLFNVVISVWALWDIAAEHGPPHWLIRLYGGKVR